MKKIYIFTGGTINKVSPHLAITAPAYGTVGVDIYRNLNDQSDYEVILMPTAMAFSAFMYFGDSGLQMKYKEVCDAAGVKWIETNGDLKKVVDYLVEQDDTRCIIMAAAVADFKVSAVEEFDNSWERRSLGSLPVIDNKVDLRLSSSHEYKVTLTPADKIIDSIRKERKDIFLVSFKATYGESFDETYKRGLAQLKRTSSNLVFANDIKKRASMIITPEEYPYIDNSREESVAKLSSMIFDRLNLNFHRTTVREGSTANLNKLWENDCIPENFVRVLSACLHLKAYKEFRGKTAGHFGCKVTGKKYARVSSVRKVDHNNVFTDGVAKIFPQEDGSIVAEGAKPSVGEHTQSMIYERLGDKVDSIIHFHCPLKKGSPMHAYTRSQEAFECGSDECGLNTTEGMFEVAEGVWVVHLEGHGPNIAFSKDVDSKYVIKIIKDNWDLDKKIAEEALENK